MAAAELAGLHKSQKRLSALKIVRDFSYSQEDFLMRCAWVTSPKLRAPAKRMGRPMKAAQGGGKKHEDEEHLSWLRIVTSP